MVFNCAITCAMSEPAPKRTYEAALRQAGVRITRQRRLVLRLLAEARDHPDAMELHRRAAAEDASVSLTTVYRTLKVLEEKGEIHRHAFEGGPSRFEPADAAHHDHLIDVDTGQVIEFRSDKIEALQREIARGLGYDIVHHRLELYGRKRRSR
jgi:Fur family transcriptional regulator, ferric uptake regulator